MAKKWNACHTSDRFSDCRRRNEAAQRSLKEWLIYVRRLATYSPVLQKTGAITLSRTCYRMVTLFLAVLLRTVLLHYVPFGDTASDTSAACCHPAASNTHCYQVTLMSNMSSPRHTLNI